MGAHRLGNNNDMRVHNMNQRSRKFAGVWLLLALLIAYPIAATLLYTEVLIKGLGGLSTLVELVYFVVAGLGWALPAGVIIKWMARPDESTRN